ncbi:MAG TPA: cytochrome c biogenesis protein CcdA, partial [Gammaproteobacteria bacterium]|nr:cytochrome c biogenesis protein CcdA [Gammaproteobacteria bacterium]
FHDQFFYLGSAMLVVLGITLLCGKLPMLHIPITTHSAGRITIASIFTMGIFSGIGSACCAPVFAGVVALSALSGTPIGGVLLAAAYVLGMVAPLFFLSWTIDRTKVLQRFSLLQRKIIWRVGSWHSETLVAHACAGIIFIGAGLFVAWLTLQGKVMSVVTWRDSVQVGWVQALEQKLSWLGVIPDLFWLAGLFVAIAMIVIAVLRQQKSKN